MHGHGLVLVLEVLGGARGLVPDAVAVVGEHHEHVPSGAADDGGEHGHHGALADLQRRVQAGHGVGVQERDGGEHQQRQRGVDEVPRAEPVRRQVPGRRVGVRGEGVEATARDDAVVDAAVGAHVAVGEGGEGAEAAAERHEGPAQDLVEGGAVAVVGDQGGQELEQEHRAAGKEFDQVRHPAERAVRHAHAAAPRRQRRRRRHRGSICRCSLLLAAGS
uniref:Uncharacterized protein n=1 Tax=Setaria italica TaxID=4555 RepID=K4AEY6_SETIT